MEKIKLFINSEKGKDILIVIVVILVGLGSFELGRLSKEDNSQDLKTNNNIQNTDNTSQVSVDNPPDVGHLEHSRRPTSGTTSADKPFFASSKGKKYYTVGCQAGKTIKESNRVYFATGEAAEAAGYTLSSSCN